MNKFRDICATVYWLICVVTVIFYGFYAVSKSVREWTNEKIIFPWYRYWIDRAEEFEDLYK